MGVAIEKIPGGLRVDGLEMLSGKCGCSVVIPCCHSYSKVKKKGDTVVFTAKTTTPETVDTFDWGYTVRKDGVTVEVSVQDARDKTIFSGYYPPEVEEWTDKGWELVEKSGEREDFGLWRCAMCKWLYKEASEDAPFDSLPDDWKCPVCMAGKDAFEKVG